MDPLILHKLVYENNAVAIDRTLQDSELDSNTKTQILSEVFRGQTPLTLAISMKHHDCIQYLLRNGASTLQRNTNNWTPYQEATSIGDREIMESLIKQRNVELSNWFCQTGKHWVKQLSEVVPDFQIEMTWKFQSWVPFFSKICPSDNYKIYKKGSCLRIDTSLVGFENLSWVRGKISIIVVYKKHEDSLIVLCDHDRKIIEQIYPRSTEMTNEHIEEEISLSLNSKIETLHKMDFSSCNIKRLQSGFWPFAVDRTDTIGAYKTSVWSIDNIDLIWKQRIEHIEARQEQEAIKETLAELEDSLAKTNWVVNNPDQDEELAKILGDDETCYEENTVDGDIYTEEELTFAQKMIKELSKYVPTLESPSNHGQWMEAIHYFDELCCESFTHLGRPLIQDETIRQMKATVWMYESLAPSSSTYLSSSNSSSPNLDTEAFPSIQSSDFPITIEHFSPVLDLIGMTNNHLIPLRDFFQIQLPPGFPIQLEIPLATYALSVVIQFQNLKTKNLELDDHIFDIPGKQDGYRPGEVLVSSTTNCTTY